MKDVRVQCQLAAGEVERVAGDRESVQIVDASLELYGGVRYHT